MNYSLFDIFSCILFMIGICIGTVRGFVREISSTVAVICASYSAYSIIPYVSEHISSHSIIVTSVCIVCGILLYSIVKVLLEYFLSKIENNMFLHLINRSLGAAAGFIKVYLLICFGTLIYFMSVSTNRTNTNISNSALMPTIVRSIKYILSKTEEHLPENMSDLSSQIDNILKNVDNVAESSNDDEEINLSDDDEEY